MFGLMDFALVMDETQPQEPQAETAAKPQAEPADTGRRARFFASEMGMMALLAGFTFSPELFW